MKLLSWRKLPNNGPGENYKLVVEVTCFVFPYGKSTRIYIGDVIWYNRDTGYQASSEYDKELCALRRRIEWGDFRELEKA